MPQASGTRSTRQTPGRPEAGKTPGKKGSAARIISLEETVSQGMAALEATRLANPLARGAVHIVDPDHYRVTPLLKEMERLCDPRTEITDPDLVNLAAKYFYSYVVEGGHHARVPLADLSELFALYSRHSSLNEPGDDIETMNRLRRFSLCLNVLADIPRIAHILRSIIRRPMPPRKGASDFLGLDLCSGSGILLVAQYILARRNRFKRILIRGMERDGIVGERTYSLCAKLGVGAVALADSAEAESYEDFRQGQPVTFVSNEAAATGHLHPRSRDLTAINETLFSVLGRGLQDTLFFPEGYIAYAREENVSMLLSGHNRFQGPREYRSVELLPQGILIEGEVVPLHVLGSDFLPYVPRQARRLLRVP